MSDLLSFYVMSTIRSFILSLLPIMYFLSFRPNAPRFEMNRISLTLHPLIIEQRITLYCKGHHYHLLGYGLIYLYHLKNRTFWYFFIIFFQVAHNVSWCRCFKLIWFITSFTLKLYLSLKPGLGLPSNC